MKPASEYQHLCALRKHEDSDVYKACVSVANHGLSLPEEEKLSPDEKTLLVVRRLIFQCQLSEAEESLRLLQPTENLLKGDKEFLLGQIFHKQGQQETAARFMSEAADYYKLTGDAHRELRARVNGAICVSTLESSLFGDLFCFEQEARRQNFFDIIGNICRVRAIELLVAGLPQEAQAQAMEAATFYKIDGYQDDRGVALYLAAISFLLIGDSQRAQDIRAEALTAKGKSEIYKTVYEDLLVGKVPKVHEGHPLFKVNWKKLVLKPESVPGKIVQRLRERPHTRDELIEKVWGENAQSQSYCSRLHTAINALRKERAITVLYDGEYYKLA